MEDIDSSEEDDSSRPLREYESLRPLVRCSLTPSYRPPYNLVLRAVFTVQILRNYLGVLFESNVAGFAIMMTVLVVWD